ncbi:MAG TPA: hypothetical protein P5228_06055 [Bacteroidales bacterium]|nr:hypothetical protein [Bacteroidales bacterium]HRZ48736.1 hypothetical protein [Bacteroidales bacterium]
MDFTLILFAIVLVAIAFAGIAIKMFFIRGAEFKKTCGSSVDPKTGKPMACSCGSNGEGEGSHCDNKPDPA